MTDRDALYAAVLGRPDDDTPRGVLADWLDDHDQPERAEFIRLGVETARTTAHCYHDLTRPPDCPVCSLHLRAAELARRTIGANDDGDIHAWEAWANLPPTGWACLNLLGDAAARRIEANLRDRRIAYPDDAPRGAGYFRFRRGFVDEVWLSLAVFAGGPCGSCDGTGYRDRVAAKCYVCDKTGRVGGLARELLAAHPLTRVVLTDREPWLNPATGGLYVWLESSDPEPRDASRIPNPLWSYLRESQFRLTHASRTRELALDALSAACVAYGRSLAPKPAPA